MNDLDNIVSGFKSRQAENKSLNGISFSYIHRLELLVFEAFKVVYLNPDYLKLETSNVLVHILESFAKTVSGEREEKM